MKFDVFERNEAKEVTTVATGLDSKEANRLLRELRCTADFEGNYKEYFALESEEEEEDEVPLKIFSIYAIYRDFDGSPHIEEVQAYSKVDAITQFYKEHPERIIISIYEV